MSQSSGPPKRNSTSRNAPGTDYRYRNQRVFVPQGYLTVGQVSGVHGLRGEVRVELHTDFPERFQPGLQIFLGDQLAPMTITQARPHKDNLLVQFAGVDNRETAERLRGLWLFIEESDATELEEDTYWIHDIVGLTVVTDQGRELGQVADVMSTGANDVYIVQTPASVNQGRDLLLPAIADVIQKIDLAAGTMTVTLLPGLLDEAPPDTNP